MDLTGCWRIREVEGERDAKRAEADNERQRAEELRTEVQRMKEGWARAEELRRKAEEREEASKQEARRSQGAAEEAERQARRAREGDEGSRTFARLACEGSAWGVTKALRRAYPSLKGRVAATLRGLEREPVHGVSKEASLLVAMAAAAPGGDGDAPAARAALIALRASSDGAKDALVAGGAAQALATRVAEGADEELLADCAAAVCNLTLASEKGRNRCRAMLLQGVGVQVAKAVRTGAGPAKKACLSCLANMSSAMAEAAGDGEDFSVEVERWLDKAELAACLRKGDEEERRLALEFAQRAVDRGEQRREEGLGDLLDALRAASSSHSHAG